MKYVFSKIAKIGLRLVLGILLLLLIFSVLISVPVIQTKIVHQLTKSISNTLETEVSIGSVSVSWTGRVELNDVLIRDRQQDTMIFVAALKGKLLSYNKKQNNIILGGVELNSPLVNFIRREGEEDMNYQFLVDLSRNQDSTGNPMEMLFTNLKMSGGTFNYKIEGEPRPTDRAFDESDFAFQYINAEFKDFKLIGDSLDFKIKKLSTSEKNGLEVKHLACKAKIHNEGMEYSEMLLRVGETVYEDYLAFRYKSYRDFADFLTKVDVEANLVDAVVSANDLAYFSYNLNPYRHNKVTLSGQAKGRVNNFKFQDFELETGKSSYIKGNLDLKGLPDWRSSFIDLRVVELSSSPGDVEDVMQIQLQDRLKEFGEFSFSGYLTGFYSDFAADGKLRSELGDLKSRINFKLLQNETADYKGELVADNFDLGRFLGTSQIGKTTFRFDLEEGHGLTFENLRTKFKSQIDFIDYNNARLQNIQAKGLYTDQTFDGDLWLKDPNLEFAFNGKMDFKHELPRFDFTADIEKINLKELGLDTVETRIAANVDIKLTGNDPDNIVGFADMKNVDVVRADQSLFVNELKLQSAIDDSTRTLSVQSDYLEGAIEGQFSLKNLDLVYKDFLHTLFPDFHDPVELKQEIKATANFQVKGNDLISYWTPYDLTLGDGKLRVEYDTREESLESWGKFDHIRYEDYLVEQYELFVRKRPHQLLNLSADAGKLESDGKLITTNLLLNASILPNFVDFLFDVADTSDVLALRSFGSMDFSNDSITVRFEESRLYLEQESWLIHPDNWATYSKKRLDVKSFRLSNTDQILILQGVISDQKEDQLRIITENLDLANFNPLLASQDLTLGGVSDGTINIRQLLRRPVLQGELDIYQLAVNGDTLGNLDLNAQTDKDPLIMDVSARVTEGLFKNVTAEGTVDLTTARGNMDLRVQAEKAAVKPMEVWFKGVASDFSGVVDGNVRVYGSFEEYMFKGIVDARGVGFKVDYLNTRYTVNDRIGLSEKSIDFRGLKVVDELNNTAEVRGQILHNRFADMYLNVAVEDANNLMVLNTDKDDNEVFYGTGFATGRASFKGPLDNIVINVKGATNKGTRLVIPVYDESDNAMVDYIRFKKVVKDTVEIVASDEEGEQKISMDFDLTLTEDAEFILLFDEVLDDKISGRGTGNIKMQYATGENFFMYGVYKITEGIYPFSSPTLVSEKFDLREGGQIVWNGDPYNAKINLQAAVARNRANPLDLMIGLVDGQEENYNTNIKVNVILNLKGELFNPEITFDWEFPESGSLASITEFNTMIRKIETDPDELNRQVFSLMTFGSFTPASNYGVGLGTSGNSYRDIVSSSVGTFLSNQVNNWISEYDNNWEFGVDYLTRSGITDQEKAELIFSARRKLINDRIELAASYNTNSSGNRNPYNVDLVYKVKKDGSLKLKAYHKLANDPTLGQISNVTTTGLGLYFRKHFNHLGIRRKKVKPE